MGIRMKACQRCGEMDFIPEQLCANCEQELRELFLVVKDYMIDNPGSNTSQISKATGVDEKAIIYMIDNDWIQQGGEGSVDRPRCTNCGLPVASGRLCAHCLAKTQQRLRGVMQTIKETEAAKPPAFQPPGSIEISEKKKNPLSKPKKY